MSGVSKDSAYYENTHTEDICRAPAGALQISYIAERLLTRPRASIESYVWNDFNPKLVETVKRRVSDSRFKIDPFDADADDVSLEKYDVFICISLEHIEADIEILNRLKSGCVVSICSPNFDDPAHVRVFTSMKQFRDRYSPVIKISI